MSIRRHPGANSTGGRALRRSPCRSDPGGPYARRVDPTVTLKRYRGALQGFRRRVRTADLGLNAAAVAYNGFLALVPLGVALLGVAAFVGTDQGALDRVASTMAAYAALSIRSALPTAYRPTA